LTFKCLQLKIIFIPSLGFLEGLHSRTTQQIEYYKGLLNSGAVFPLLLGQLLKCLLGVAKEDKKVFFFSW
jgi:hypothetical protein